MALSSVLVLDKVARRLEVLVDHLFHERVEVNLALPPELLLRFCGVAEQQAACAARSQSSRKRKADR